MDIVLERILSLLPRTEEGKFVRGSKKELALKLGFTTGDIVSMWISGQSASYKRYLHQIADLYDVSVDWLCGLTDDPRRIKSLNADVDPVAFIKSISGSMTNAELVEAIRTLTEALGNK